jgi:CubicO group peptidase (beta-lactamase class C family)
LIQSHIADGRYPGAQIALARHGKLALYETFGRAVLEPSAAASADTLWLLFSNTKVITAAGIWALVEDGRLRFSDRIAEHIPEFARHGKGNITLAQVISHRAGFPGQGVSPQAWTDHARMRSEVCDFTLEWTPGSRLHYHPKSAFWTAAALIEAVTQGDYRDFLTQSSSRSGSRTMSSSACPMRSTSAWPQFTSPAATGRSGRLPRKTQRLIAAPVFRAAAASRTHAAWRRFIR